MVCSEGKGMTPGQYKELIADLHRRDPADLKLEYAWKRGGRIKRILMALFALIQWVILAAIIAAFAMAVVEP